MWTQGYRIHIHTLPLPVFRHKINKDTHLCTQKDTYIIHYHHHYHHNQEYCFKIGLQTIYWWECSGKQSEFSFCRPDPFLYTGHFLLFIPSSPTGSFNSSCFTPHSPSSPTPPFPPPPLPLNPLPSLPPPPPSPPPLPLPLLLPLPPPLHLHP